MEDLELLDELGKGNYGTVRKVLHTRTKVHMAMKVSIATGHSLAGLGAAISREFPDVDRD